MTPRLGVFGGSGFYEFLDDAVDHVVDTPYGPPAAPVVVGIMFIAPARARRRSE